MTVLDHLLRSHALCADQNGNDVVALHALPHPLATKNKSR